MKIMEISEQQLNQAAASAETVKSAAKIIENLLVQDEKKEEKK